MIARLLILTSLKGRVGEINRILTDHQISLPHPDLLYFSAEDKLGINEARIIKKHFSLKPYSAKGRAVVIEDASTLTHDAQNALLKILEEPPSEAMLILGAPSDAKFLPTVLSRCQITRVQGTGDKVQRENYKEDIKKLLNASIGERFEYVEKLKDKKEFLNALVYYFHQNLPQNTNFTKELLQAEEWAEANVNIRAILEYLMLVMPSKI